MEKSLNQTQLLSSLVHIGHGNLEEYQKIGSPVNQEDPYLFGHLTAWNLVNGKVRDSKIAFPPIALRGSKVTPELAENAVACMMSLGPRELVKSYRFSCQLSKAGHIIPNKNRRLLEHGLKRYIRVREEKESWWDRTILFHRKAMKLIYTYSHVIPSPRAQTVLFDKNYPEDSVFYAIKSLRTMNPLEASGLIRKYKIPFPITITNVDSKDSDILMALIDVATGNELIKYTSTFKKIGVFQNPVLNQAYQEALNRAKQDKRVDFMQISVAIDSIEDESLVKKLSQVQEAQTKLLTIDGDWAVLGDRSGSMVHAIDLAKQVAGFLAHQVKGNIYLIFFNTSPQLINVTGKSIQEINQLTKGIIATGGTSIGCGIQYLAELGIPVQGIAIISDGAENNDPLFTSAYQHYGNKMGITPTIYLYLTQGQTNLLSYNCKHEDIEITMFNLSHGIDEYALPNLIKTMRTSRFSLLDEILNTPLVTFKDVFDK